MFPPPLLQFPQTCQSDMYYYFRIDRGTHSFFPPPNPPTCQNGLEYSIRKYRGILPPLASQQTSAPRTRPVEYSIRNNEGVTFVDPSQSQLQPVVSSTIGIFLPYLWRDPLAPFAFITPSPSHPLSLPRHPALRVPSPLPSVAAGGMPSLALLLGLHAYPHGELPTRARLPPEASRPVGAQSAHIIRHRRHSFTCSSLRPPCVPPWRATPSPCHRVTVSPCHPVTLSPGFAY